MKACKKHLCFLVFFLSTPWSFAKVNLDTYDLRFGIVPIGFTEFETVQVTNEGALKTLVHFRNFCDESVHIDDFNCQQELGFQESCFLSVYFSPIYEGKVRCAIGISEAAGSEEQMLVIRGQGVSSLFSVGTSDIMVKQIRESAH